MSDILFDVDLFLSHKSDDGITLSYRIARVTLAPPTLLVCITKVQLIIQGNPLSKSYIVSKKRYLAFIQIANLIFMWPCSVPKILLGDLHIKRYLKI